MKFPNLVWAVAQRRLPHYRVAAAARMSESRFSRCLAGRLEFSPRERQTIAKVLGFPTWWLFKQVEPPPSGEAEPMPLRGLQTKTAPTRRAHRGICRLAPPREQPK
jgi:hypothetical protein